MLLLPMAIRSKTNSLLPLKPQKPVDIIVAGDDVAARRNDEFRPMAMWTRRQDTGVTTMKVRLHPGFTPDGTVLFNVSRR
jgi:hypothetical protein